MSAAVAKAPALPPDQSFIAFEFSPEPEEALQPSTTGPNNASSSSTTTTAANGGVGSKAAQKRSRDERDKEEREALDKDDPRAYRNKKEQQRAEGGRRDTPWVNGIDWDSCRNPAEMLNKEIQSFVSYIAPSRVEHATRAHIVALIRRAVTVQWSDAQVIPFGSFETGLYLPTGDIDLVIQSDKMDKQNKVTVLHTLASVLRRANLAENIQVIAKAKVPIVKFISSYGRLPIDISLNQLNGISAGKIVNSYISALPALKPLVLVIKAFLSQRGMNEVYSGGLGSYSVICLVVSFLQVHPKIRRAEIDPVANLGVLLIEFFELYGKHFGYDESGISLRDGGGYFSKFDRGWQNERQKYLLSIEDPQDASNDISRSSFGIIRVRSTFAGAYEVLTSRLYLRAQEIVGRRSGRNQQRSSDVQMSVLVGIMGVTEDVLRHRRLINQLHDAGTLQKMLGVTDDPTIDLPSFSQTLGTSSASSSSRPGHKRFSRSPSPPSRRSPPRIAEPKRSVLAIHVGDSSDSEVEERGKGKGKHGKGKGKEKAKASSGRRRSDEGYDSSDSSSFSDKPFKPSTASSTKLSASSTSTKTKLPLSSSLPSKPSGSRSTQPAPPPSASSSSSSKPPRPNTTRSPSPDDSRYSATSKPNPSKRSRGRQHSFSPAPGALPSTSTTSAQPPPKKKPRRPSPTISINSSDSSSSLSSSEDGQTKDDYDSMYIEGQEELLMSDEEAEKEKKQSRGARKQAREAKRAYWAAKGGDSRMEGMRFDLLESGSD